VGTWTNRLIVFYNRACVWRRIAKSSRSAAIRTMDAAAARRDEARGEIQEIEGQFAKTADKQDAAAKLRK